MVVGATVGGGLADGEGDVFFVDVDDGDGLALFTVVGVGDGFGFGFAGWFGLGEADAVAFAACWSVGSDCTPSEFALMPA